MNKVTQSTLICDDNDINCSCKLTEEDSINKINLGSLNFRMVDLQKFDMIVYRGSAGCKILKSKYTSVGVINKK